MPRVLLLLALLFFAGPAWAERRVALVIGDDDYKTIRKLDSAVTDAQSVGEALKKLGFEVAVETNRDLKRMRRALDDFREDGAGADVALVFFAGHGVEISGDNRLLPTDADASSLEELKATTIPLEEVRAAVAEVSTVGLIILDACRNNPFGTSLRAGASGERSVVALAQASEVRPGLGRIGRAEGILFAFSAAPGETAADGTDGHSPFASALVKYLGTEGLEVRSALTLVQEEVYDRSRGKQLPYIESGLPRLFFAATSREQLPERERLLLAMAEVTPQLRSEVESVAAANDMPLAPLYAALVSADLGKFDREQRTAKLQEAAAAFVRVRDELKSVAAADPEVETLRRQAEDQLALGAYKAAHELGERAAELDRQSAEILQSRAQERFLSEAATHVMNGSIARAALRYDDAIADYERAAAIYDRYRGQPLAQADRDGELTALIDLGDIYVNTGDIAKARGTFDRRLNTAQVQAAADPDNPSWQRDVAVSHNRLADVLLAQGNTEVALEAYRASLRIMNGLAAREPGNAKWQHDLCISHARMGEINIARGNYSEAESEFRVSLGIAARFAERAPEDTVWQNSLAVAHQKLGDVETARGDFDGALQSYRGSAAVLARLVAGHPENAEWQRNLTVAQDNIGAMLAGMGDFVGALAAYKADLEILVGLAARDPADVNWQRDVASTYSLIADVLLRRGDFIGALGATRSEFDIVERLAAADPENADWQRDLSLSYLAMGDVLLKRNDTDGALGAFRSAERVADQLVRVDASNVEWLGILQKLRTRLGNALVSKGDLDGALNAYSSGLESANELVRIDTENPRWQGLLAAAYERVGRIHDWKADFPQALGSYHAALDIDASLAARYPDDAGIRQNLMILHYSIGMLGEDIVQHFTKVIEIGSRLQRDGTLDEKQESILRSARKVLAERDAVLDH